MEDKDDLMKLSAVASLCRCFCVMEGVWFPAIDLSRLNMCKMTQYWEDVVLIEKRKILSRMSMTCRWSLRMATP